MADEKSWLGLATDLGRLLARGAPVTFVIGAGCSLSSGCPTTSAVTEAFRTCTYGRLNGQIRDLLHEVLPPEHVAIVQPLFRNISPYIGYLSLAALARSRHVIVLNLNWDKLVELACEEMEVDCFAVDLRDLPPDFSLEDTTSRPGVTCVHLHGTTDKNPRFSKLETLTFSNQSKVFLKGALRHTTVIAGATLLADTDMMNLIDESIQDDKEQSSVWQFSRVATGGSPSGYGDAGYTSKSSPYEGRPGFYHARGPDFDFDRLLVALLGASLDRLFDLAFRDEPWLSLPKYKQLIWPSRRVLVECLPTRELTIFLGEPQLGKSTAARLLAYIYSLWLPVEDASIKLFEGPHQTMAALSSSASTPGIYLLEDPFGSTRDFEPNPGFLEQLTRLYLTPNRSKVIVISRLMNWSLGTESSPASSHLVPCPTSQWYEVPALKLAAQVRDAARKDILDRIDQGELDTPARLDAAFSAQQLLRAGAVQPDVFQEKLAILEHHPALAILCSLVRLQEFAGTDLPKAELVSMSKLGAQDAAAMDVFLKSYSFEEDVLLTLKHATDKEAVDAFLEQNISLVKGAVSNHWVPHERELLETIKLVEVVHALKQGQLDVVKQLSPREIHRWCAAIFSAAPTVQTLDAIGVERLDAWATVELAYELVRLWPVLRKSGARHRVLEAFASHRAGHGTYALVEASLYLGHSVDPEVQTAIQSALWRLLDDSSADARREAILIVDAFAWRPMAESAKAWLAAFIEAAGTEPIWTGFLRFCHGYHAAGAASLVGNAQEAGPLSSEEAATVAWLVRWHFVHQSHSRTLLSRTRIVDKAFLCRSLHLSPQDSSKALSKLIVRLAEHVEHRGWAFHLCCNAMALGLGVEEETLQKLDSLFPSMPSGDIGSVLAALTYESAYRFRALKRYMKLDANRLKALELMQVGVHLEGIHLHPPRFTFVQDPTILERRFSAEWPNLWKQNIDTQNIDQLIADLTTAATKLVEKNATPPDITYDVIRTVAKGDLREIEHAVVARDATTDKFEHIVRAAVELRRNSQGKLF